jgi:hypothetical protein
VDSQRRLEEQPHSTEMTSCHVRKRGDVLNPAVFVRINHMDRWLIYVPRLRSAYPRALGEVKLKSSSSADSLYQWLGSSDGSSYDRSAGNGMTISDKSYRRRSSYGMSALFGIPC